MSVPLNKRTVPKLEVIVRTVELSKYVLDITANEKVFKPMYSKLADKIISTSIEIHTCAWDANNINVSKDKTAWAERSDLQKRSARLCNRLLSLLPVAKRVYHLKAKRIEHWTKLIVGARELIRAWHKADCERYRNL